MKDNDTVENKKILENTDNNHSLYNNVENRFNYNDSEIENILSSIKNKVTVFIYICNNFENAKNTIESVLKHSKSYYDLLLINDASTDKKINDLLNSYSNFNNIQIINNSYKQGYARCVNLAFSKTNTDIILLDNNAIATNKWIEKLKVAAYSKPDIATVTPLSNNSDFYQVREDSKLPVDDMANIIEKSSLNIPLTVPCAGSFCMYIKRDAINDIGYFDLGFNDCSGGEKDFSMRLSNAGWINVVDSSTYVHHKTNSSKSDQYNLDNHYLINKHPSYNEIINTFVKSDEYEHIKQDINLQLSKEYNNKKCMLFVMHDGKGGTPYTTVDLISNIKDDYEAFLLAASNNDMKLYKFTAKQDKNNVEDEYMNYFDLLESWKLTSEYTIETPHNKSFRNIYFNIIKLLHVDIIHIRHLIKHSFDLPYLAKLFNIPVVLSFHDFYYVCPSHNLLDNNNNYCGGYCTPANKNDKKDQCNVAIPNAPLCKSFVNTWRKYVKDMFAYCDAFVTTSKSTYDIYTKFYPELKNKDFRIIEHGRNLKTPDTIVVPKLEKDKPIRMLISGHTTSNKGGFFIGKLKKYDADNNIELHYLGKVDNHLKLEDTGIFHGVYKRSDFSKLVKEINPHASGIFSIWPETYCHTLTESWSCGLPVISFDIGALGERIKSNGGGFLISKNPKEAYHEILKIFSDYDRYSKAAEEISNITFKTTEDMAKEYLEIYNGLLQEHVQMNNHLPNIIIN